MKESLQPVIARPWQRLQLVTLILFVCVAKATTTTTTNNVTTSTILLGVTTNGTQETSCVCPEDVPTTNSPSSQPSYQPTHFPSSLPSTYPSDFPSESPSVYREFFVGDKAAFELEVFNFSQSVRQDVCDRFDQFHNDSEQFPLRTALSGLELRPIIGISDYFPYDQEQGIDPAYPGLLGEILDDLARRANFTWRKSFAVYDAQKILAQAGGTHSYTDLLLWNTQAFDIAIDGWDKTPDRMEAGISFLEPWMDGSKILLSKQLATELGDDGNTVIDFWNWTKPFEQSVWALIVFTIVLSGMVYQLIEHLQGQREDRSFGQWTSDNLYLSAINFSQNFEYAPQSAAGRIFATSMTLWALVMTATYTANLASLFVENNREVLIIESIEQAVSYQIEVCVKEGSYSHQYLKREYPGALLKAYKTKLEVYQSLQAGRCGLAVSTTDGWKTRQGDARFNPSCELETIGKTILDAKAGFAIKGDAGQLCTTFIREVLNLHMVELIHDGDLEILKDNHRRKVQEANPNNCAGDTISTGDQQGGNGRRRQLQQLGLVTSWWRDLWQSSSMTQQGSKKTDNKRNTNPRRELIGGGAPPLNTQGNAAEGHSPSLTLEQMLGTFVLHWMLMAFAVGLAALTTAWQRFQETGGRAIQIKKEEDPDDDSQSSPQQQKDVEKATVTRDTESVQESFISSGGFDWEAEYARMSVDEKAMVDFLFKRMHLQGRLSAPPPPTSSQPQRRWEDGFEDVDSTGQKPWSLSPKPNNGFALQFPFCN